ncbi:MAG: hypothetical protein HYR88_15105 [Verrucomicrobia bacterium]|nr:hypothetical protein [Verrucomicrobiota bacterium]MBI3866972.1 hypothetical protein [Verrucomicrobiota bacterium]
MQELTDPRWIKIKGLLFLFLGLGSAGLLLLDRFNLKDAALLSIAVWCFCRFYYFAFYVIERYVDPAFRFSGLWAFAGYLWGRRRDRESTLRADVR